MGAPVVVKLAMDAAPFTAAHFLITIIAIMRKTPPPAAIPPMVAPPMAPEPEEDPPELEPEDLEEEEGVIAWQSKPAIWNPE